MGRKFSSPSDVTCEQLLNSEKTAAESNRKIRRNESIDLSWNGEMTNIADAQDGESKCDRDTSQERRPEMERKQSGSEVVDEDLFSCEGKSVTPFDNTLINFVLPRSIGKAIDKCNEEQRTTIVSDDLIQAAESLGVQDFLDGIKSYVQHHISSKSEESTSRRIELEVPGYEDWYDNLQDLLKMVPGECSPHCPCRLVRFRKDNYK